MEYSASMPRKLYPEVEVTNLRVGVEKRGDSRIIRADIKPVDRSLDTFSRARRGCAVCPLKNPDLLGQMVLYGEVIECGGFGTTRRAAHVTILIDVPTPIYPAKPLLPEVLEGNCAFQSKPVAEAVDSGKQSVRFGPHEY